MKFLFPPVSAEEKSIRLVLFRLLLWGHIIFGLLFALLGSFLPNVAARYGLMGLGYMLSGLLAMGLDKLNRPEWARRVLVSLAMLIVTISAITAGGVRSLAFLNFVGLALMTGLVFGELMGMIVVGVTLLFGLVLVVAETGLGLRFPEVYHSVWSIWMAYLFILPMAIGMQYLYTYGMRKAILQAEEELGQRKQAEEQFRRLVDATPNALFVADRMGNIILANHPTERVFGYSVDELKGKSVDIFIPPALRPRHKFLREEFFSNPLGPQMVPGRELVGVRKNGEPFPLEVGLSPLKTAEGFQLLVSIMDITERKRAETTRQHLLEISQAALSAATPAEIMEKTMKILRSSVPFDHAGLRFVDREAKVLRFVCSVGSVDVNELTKQWEIPMGQGIASTVVQTGIPECVNHAHLDPRTIYAPGFVIEHEHALCLPLCAGEVNFGVLFVARYSDPPFSEEEFEEAKMFLSHVTLAVYNAHLRQVDQARLDELESLYAQIQGQKTLLEERVSSRTAELHTEIAERKQIEEMLRQHVGHLSLLHQITLDLIQQHNIEKLLQTIVNQTSKLLDVDWGILTLKEGEYLVDRVQLQNARISYELLASRREEDPLSPIWQVLDTGEPFIVEDYSSLPTIRPQTAALGISAAILLPIFIGNACQGILGTGRVRPGKMFTDEELQFGTLLARIAGIILENAHLHETLRQEAIRDPLTNLYNRRFMEESLARELQRAERDQHPLTVAMLDIDHFKRFNDTYGHSAGDEVLQILGEILQRNFRGGDIACRYGGEEFVLILPGTEAQAVSRHLEILRKEIASQDVEFDGQYLPAITISGGLAEASAEVATAEGLLKKADVALYRAKSEGRDRIVIA